MKKVLTGEDALSVISANRLGHLGCIADGEPYVVPINYLVEDNAVYCHSSLGMKIKALRSNPRVCLQVDDIQSDFQWRSAIAFGRFEEIHDEEQRSEIVKKLLARFPLLTPVESVAANEGGHEEVVVFRINVNRVTGVSEE